MKVKCRKVVADFSGVFPKNQIFEASELKNGICEVEGLRKKKDGTDWAGVLSLGCIVVLGVACFDILPPE